MKFTHAEVLQKVGRISEGNARFKFLSPKSVGLEVNDWIWKKIAPQIIPSADILPVYKLNNRQVEQIYADSQNVSDAIKLESQLHAVHIKYSVEHNLRICCSTNP